MFRTQFDSRRPVYADPGDRIKVQYIGQYDDHGNVVLKETGVVDTYALIQSHRDSVDINVLIKRYVNGDTAALERVQGQYLDCTRLPKSYMDVLNTTIQAEADFMRLPVEIRAKFGHNFAAYLAELGSADWMEKMQLNKPNPAKSSVSSEVISPAEGGKVNES